MAASPNPRPRPQPVNGEVRHAHPRPGVDARVRQPTPKPAAPAPEPEPAAGFSSDAIIDAVAKVVAGIEDEISELRAENQRLNGEIAKLCLIVSEQKAALAEVRAKADTSAFVLERLRTLNKGDTGATGPMGRDGAEGKTGPRGEAGRSGRPGVTLQGWIVDADQFTVYGVLGDGSRTAGLELGVLFDTYHRLAGAEDEANEMVASTEAMALAAAR
jgi:hypothetical protein